MKIKIVAPLEPVPFPRPRFSTKGRVFNPSRYTDFKDELGLIATLAMKGRAPLKGAIKLHADFFKRRPKKITSQNWGDGDNHLKAVMDALQGICYENDAQVIHGTFTKNYGEPQIKIMLEEYECGI